MIENNCVVPYDALTEEDINKIDLYRTLYGHTDNEVAYSGYKAEVSHILREWNRAKGQHLFKMFNHQLILEYPITYEDTFDALVTNFVNNFWDTESENFISIFKTKCCDFFEDITWQPRAKETRIYNFANMNMSNMIDYLFSSEQLARNAWPQYQDNMIFTPKSEYNLPPIVVSENTKIMRVIGKISKMIGLEKEFYNFRCRHSQFLNQKTITGTICLSIHPLDYMTMSDNNSGWDSCMKWQEDGEYRVGTIEMMNSAMVVCAYVKSNKTPFYIDPSTTWNNKKWRELFIVNSDVITEVKPYPYVNKTFTNFVLNKLKTLAYEAFGWEYEDEAREHKYREAITQSAQPGTATKISFWTDGMYNDFGTTRNGIHDMFIAKNFVKANGPAELSIGYSGLAVCVWCGDIFDGADDPSRVECNCCDDNGIRCCCCGRHVHQDYAYYEGDDYYCEECHDEYYIYDDYYEEYILREEAEILQIYSDEVDENNEHTVLYQMVVCADSIRALFRPHGIKSDNDYIKSNYDYPIYDEQTGKYYIYANWLTAWGKCCFIS